MSNSWLFAVLLGLASELAAQELGLVGAGA
jgi:hypothetical protein